MTYCEDCTYHACNFGECKYDDTFMDFEIWMENVEVSGFWNKETPNSNEWLEWFTWDGFECGHDFSKTNKVGEVANTENEVDYLIKWCLIEDFLSKVNVAQKLYECKDEEAIITYGADDFRLQLYINCKKQFD